LTGISAGDIISISEDDITVKDIKVLIKIKEVEMGEFKERIALTEAVYYILLSLFEPLHGYGIMQNAQSLSHGRVNLAAGTLYGALNTLMEKGYIKALPGESNTRKKEYVITATGKEIVMQEIERLRELVKNGEDVLRRNER